MTSLNSQHAPCMPNDVPHTWACLRPCHTMARHRQATQSALIAWPPAIEHLALVTFSPSLECITAPSGPEEDMGEPTLMCSSLGASQVWLSYVFAVEQLALVPALTIWGASYAPQGHWRCSLASPATLCTSLIHWPPSQPYDVSPPL